MFKATNKILCIGACHIDYKFKVKEAIIKGTSNPVDSKMSYGGVVRNVAENLSLFKRQISLMTLVGKDILGDKLIDDMKDMMDTTYIEQRDNHSTGQYYAVLDQKGNMDVAYANMSIYDDMDGNWIKKHSENIKNFDFLIVDLNVQKSGISGLIEITRQKAIPLAIIGVSGPKMKNLPHDLKGLDILIVNKDESQAYFNCGDDSESLCKRWLDKGVKIVVITSGEEDVHFADPRDIGVLPVIQLTKEKMVDTTGAGDAFSAGVLLGLLEHKSLEKSVTYGLVNASLTIQSDHSVRKDIEELDFIEEVKKYE